jgi:hypothetical protein
MVFNAHAQRVDENCDENAAREMIANDESLHVVAETPPHGAFAGLKASNVNVFCFTFLINLTQSHRHTDLLTFGVLQSSFAIHYIRTPIIIDFRFGP